MSDPTDGAPEPGDPTEPLPSEPPEELLITPMSDPDVPPGEPTMIIPVVPSAVPPEPTAAMPADTVPPVTPVPPPPPPPPWWKEHWWVVAVVALALVALIIFILWLTADDDNDALETNESTIATSSLPSTSAPVTTAPATTAPTSTEPATTAPATTEATTTTTEATTTTTTEAPTTTTTQATTTTTAASTTTVAPTTTLPPPINGSGSGNRIVPVSNPGGGLGVATFSHNGASKFTVQALDQAAKPIGGLLVDRVGAYQGTVVLPDGTAALNITADGAWQFEDQAPGAARPFDGRNDSGSGDDVMLYDGDPATARITFAGDGPFVVRSFADNGGVDELVSVDSGPFDDSVGFPGPALVAVSGNGNWTIALS
jgi:hypothetical protein